MKAAFKFSEANAAQQPVTFLRIADFYHEKDDFSASVFPRGRLLVCPAYTRDDCTGVGHVLAGRRGYASDVANQLLMAFSLM
ncbi:hypothetical protein ACNKU7_12515 [Microbulbifer sp. SA54]|uniref:hypothetical protein n=1 Tax=Microbulbifer sp. SA54 TaxID=3401577 RepID=UPI003AAEE76C